MRSWNLGPLRATSRSASEKLTRASAWCDFDDVELLLLLHRPLNATQREGDGEEHVLVLLFPLQVGEDGDGVLGVGTHTSEHGGGGHPRQLVLLRIVQDLDQ